MYRDLQAWSMFSLFILASTVMVPAASGKESLPWPVATSYGSVDPEASAEWMVEYLGAERIDVNWTMTCGSAAWVRFGGSGYEFHFVSTPRLARGNFTFRDFVSYASELYGNVSRQNASSYDQFMDYHVGMILEDMTPIYEKLRGQFFMVGQYPSFFDLFVEIPGTGAILELTSQRLDVKDAELTEWDICQVGNEQRRLAMKTDAINWRKTTFAAPYPVETELFAVKYLGARHIQQAHVGVWIRGCAKIAWVQFDYEGPFGIPYQFHMVDGYSYPPRDGLDVPAFARLQESQRNFESNKLDEWLHNRLEMWVDDLTSYLEAFDRDDVSYVLRFDGALYTVLIDTTPFAGQVIALVSDKLQASYTVNITRWGQEFCG